MNILNTAVKLLLNMCLCVFGWRRQISQVFVMTFGTLNTDTKMCLSSDPIFLAAVQEKHIYRLP